MGPRARGRVPQRIPVLDRLAYSPSSAELMYTAVSSVKTYA